MFITILFNPSKDKAINQIKSIDKTTFYTDLDVQKIKKQTTENLRTILIEKNPEILIEATIERKIIIHQISKIKNHHVLCIKAGASRVAEAVLINKKSQVLNDNNEPTENEEYSIMQLEQRETIFLPISQSSNDQLLAFFESMQCFSEDKQLSIYNAMVEPSLTTRLGMLENEVYGKKFNHKVSKLPNKKPKSKIFTRFFKKIKELEAYLSTILFIIIILVLGWFVLSSNYLQILNGGKFKNSTTNDSPEITNSTNNSDVHSTDESNIKDQLNKQLKKVSDSYKENIEFYKYFDNKDKDKDKKNRGEVLAWIKIILKKNKVTGIVLNKELITAPIDLLETNYKNFSPTDKYILKFIFCEKKDFKEQNPVFTFTLNGKPKELKLPDLVNCESVLTDISESKINILNRIESYKK